MPAPGWSGSDWSWTREDVAWAKVGWQSAVRAGGRVKQLLFVTGFPGGGTDLVKNVLNAHPAIGLAGELPALPRLLRRGYGADTRIRSEADLDRLRTILAKLDIYGNVGNLAGAFSQDELASGVTLAEALRRLLGGDAYQVWGSKTPQFTERIARLNQLFPDAKFLVVVRDVRDVCLSWRRKWGRDMAWCAHKWGRRMGAGAEMAAALPAGQTEIVHFEALLADVAGSCRRLCAFLDVPFSARMLAYEQTVSDIVDGKVNYGQPLQASNTQKWRTEIGPDEAKRIEEIAWRTMRRYGYQPQLATASTPIRSWELRRGQARDLAAMLLVGNRASGQNNMKQRLRRLAQLVWQRWSG